MKLKWYSKQALWTLFLVCALLPHVWTFILFFNDTSMLLKRTGGLWETISVLAYSLLYAFIESLFIWWITLLLGLLVSRRWEESQRIVLLGFLITLLLFWIVVSQAYQAWPPHVPVRLVRFLAPIPNLFEIMYTVSALTVLSSVLIPTLLILNRKSFYTFMQGIVDRVTLLSSIYLAIDVLALIIVVIRNI